ncbi:MAG: sodium:proton antiporter NhaD [Bacteroidia bacterium]
MILTIILIFIIGYLAIAFEHPLHLNKAASALITGVMSWVVFIHFNTDKELVNEQLMHHLGNISGILFFLLGAMVIVELIDAHDGFEIISQRISTKKIRNLLWMVCGITFFLSAILDNLTTTIVMISLLRKLVEEQKKRLLFAGMIVIAANAGGAWSPLGDVTTTMLWIGGQISPVKIMSSLILPSLVCMLIPLIIVSFRFKGSLKAKGINASKQNLSTTALERNVVFFTGLGCLIFVPVFKTLTHLPPFMGILIGLGVMWVITEIMHKRKDSDYKDNLSVAGVLRKIDTSSILFFMGILLAISALESSGLLKNLALSLSQTFRTDATIAMLLGLLSAIVDNVPLVAAAQGMYSLEQFPADHYFWEFLAYSTGVGGSVLIIGSAAGVAAMGLEKINFIWYLKNISLLALLGFFAGAGVYIIMN